MAAIRQAARSSAAGCTDDAGPGHSPDPDDAGGQSPHTDDAGGNTPDPADAAGPRPARSAPGRPSRPARSAPDRPSRAARILPPVLLAAILIAIWQAAVEIWQIPSFILPAPSALIAALPRVAAPLAQDTVTTVIECLGGLAIGTVAGVCLAIVIGLWPLARRALYPLLAVSQTIPMIVLAPLLVIWAGYGMTPKVIVVALTVFYPVLVSTSAALRQPDQGLMDMATGLGASRWRTIWMVQLPSAIPGALAGLRIAATYAMGAAVVGEYMAGDSGLGVFIQRSSKTYAIDQIFLAVAVIALCTLALWYLVTLLTRVLTPWQIKDKDNS